MREFGNRGTVVVVEDDENIRQALATTLMLEGYEVSTFGSGRTAIARSSRQRRPSVVILDLSLGDMSGGQCLDQIRSSAWADVPVLVFSGWGHLDRFHLDVQARLSKTCDPESIVRAVERLARLDAGPPEGQLAGRSGDVRVGPKSRP